MDTARPSSVVLTETIDCAICQSPMVEPSFGGGCAHHFCFDCYQEWAQRNWTCPTCRAPVWCITRDFEFARVIGAEHSCKSSTKEPDEENRMGRRRTVHLEGPAGITISNGRGGRCIVTKVVRGNGAHRAGIRVGEVIEAVNGTEVHDHSIAVECIGTLPRDHDILTCCMLTL